MDARSFTDHTVQAVKRWRVFDVNPPNLTVSRNDTCIVFHKDESVMQKLLEAFDDNVFFLGIDGLIMAFPKCEETPLLPVMEEKIREAAKKDVLARKAFMILSGNEPIAYNIDASRKAGVRRMIMAALVRSDYSAQKAAELFGKQSMSNRSHTFRLYGIPNVYKLKAAVSPYMDQFRAELKRFESMI